MDESLTGTLIRRVAAALAILLAAAVPAAFAQAPGGQQGPPPGVIVETVRQRDVTETRSFTGRVQAVDKVELIARVEGFLASQEVEDGAEVDKDQLIFVIEKAPYQAAVDEAEANLASAEASGELARVNFKRAETLVKRRTVSEAQLDQARAQLLESRAAAKAAAAALTRARLNLGYTEVRAPMAGRIGRVAFSVGDLVGPTAGPLTTLVAQDPMYVAFPVPTRILLAVRREGVNPDSVLVRLDLPDGTTYDHQGTIRFADVEADATTDTVTVRATVPNPDRLLVDRQLVGVTVVGKKPRLRLVMSQSALLVDQQGSYVLAVDPDNRVEARRVSLGEQLGSQIVVTGGLAAGDRVIVSGLQKVRPGMTVAPQEIEGDGAPAPITDG